MNLPIKIGIVEDEFIIAEKIKSALSKLGYEVLEPAMNYADALKMIEHEKPDLLMLDIQLKEKQNGIELANTINKQFGIPFIFLSANTDVATFELAKAALPLSFLPKPFTKAMLFTAIEVAFNNYNIQKREQLNASPKAAEKDYLFLKDGAQFRKLFFRDILYIDCEHNYVTIFLMNLKKIVLRTSLHEFESHLPSAVFMRIHRSYIINLLLVETVDRLNVKMEGNVSVSIGSSFHDELIKRLGIES